jgi:hypothetical protein
MYYEIQLSHDKWKKFQISNRGKLNELCDACLKSKVSVWTHITLIDRYIKH